mmetsp:Transcript_26435/g.87669  ORF Transcript_26435/g.87669 Transcript_26435/m.87669 type:complete len:1005 (-) Transcript_26435:90-3104(-)
MLDDLIYEHFAARISEALGDPWAHNDGGRQLPLLSPPSLSAAWCAPGADVQWRPQGSTTSLPAASALSLSSYVCSDDPSGADFAEHGWDELRRDPSWQGIVVTSPLLPRGYSKRQRPGRAKRPLPPLPSPSLGASTSSGRPSVASGSRPQTSNSSPLGSTAGATWPPRPQTTERAGGDSRPSTSTSTSLKRGRFRISAPLLLPEELRMRPRAAGKGAKTEAEEVAERRRQELEERRLLAERQQQQQKMPARRNAHVSSDTLVAGGMGIGSVEAGPQAAAGSRADGLRKTAATGSNPLDVLKRKVEGKCLQVKEAAGADVASSDSDASDSDVDDDEVPDMLAFPRLGGDGALARKNSIFSPKLDLGSPAQRAQPKLLVQVRQEKDETTRTLGRIAEQTDRGIKLRRRLAKGLESQAREKATASLCSFAFSSERSDVGVEQAAQEPQESARKSDILASTPDSSAQASGKETSLSSSFNSERGRRTRAHVPSWSTQPAAKRSMVMASLGQPLPQKKVEFVVEPTPAVLRHLKLKTEKIKRLDRLKRLTTLHFSSRIKMDFVLRDVDRARYKEVFERYDYNKSGGLDLAEIHDALSDLGLKPMDRKDKLDIKQAVDAGGGECDFVQFVKFVHEQQTHANQGQRSKLMKLFQRYDKDNSGSLSAEELLQVFADLDLSPERDDERLAFLEAVMESDVDGSGEIEWAEFEMLVHVVRQKISQCRREREVRLCQQMMLPPHIFLNFRHILISLHDSFRQYDLNGQGTMLKDAVPELILARGFDMNLKHTLYMMEDDAVIAPLLTDREEVDFAVLLQVIQRFREVNEGVQSEDLHRIFEMYDMDNNGTLTEEEILKLMRDLGLEEWKDVNEVTRIIDECDQDGNGVISFEEFETVFQYVTELQERHLRGQEREFAMKLGFSDLELRELREIFAVLDSAEAGLLSFQDVTKALHIMGHTNESEDVICRYDPEKIGRLDFKSFLAVMRDAVPTQQGGKPDRLSVLQMVEAAMTHE